MGLRQFDRFDCDLSQRMGVESGDDVPDVMRLSNPHHDVVDVVLYVNLSIVVRIKALICELELPELATLAKFKFIDQLKKNFNSLDSLADDFRNAGDEAKANAVESAAALLNMNTVYDVQNTKSAEFWRKFK